ncbi:MAG: RNA 2',3'-cyclic phosphodiesterase [Acidobacteriales bacterium]|nr:RNA 2',3'-cyclic phosphodiesterase [Terriglobales bacterium]
MRLFVAFDIDAVVVERIERFMNQMRELSPDVRWIDPKSLHATLKFIGEQKPENLQKINAAMSQISEGPVELDFRGVGFFPAGKPPSIFWAGITPHPRLMALAHAVSEAASKIGITGEERAYTPHLTLARSGPRRRSRSANPLLMLKKKLPQLEPEFGKMTAREFFLYESRSTPAGSEYTKIAAFPLGGKY